MTFISKRTSAQFYNEGQMTFLVRKECIDIVFKIKRGLYLSVSVYSLSDNRLLLACDWGEFWNRMKNMPKRDNVIGRLRKTCPLAANIFTNRVAPHFAYLDNKEKAGAVVVEMKAPVSTNSISDYLHDKVVDKAIELMSYNLNLYTELEEKCPFKAWKHDFDKLYL